MQATCKPSAILVHQNHYNCFSETWEEAHDLFSQTCDELAKTIDGIERLTHELTAKGANGETLFISAIYIPPASRSTEHLVIINSGIHGAEAAAGSASIIQLLKTICEEPSTIPATTGTFIIHIMNPYGFAHKRTQDGLQYGAIRVNSNGVDLNRNFRYETRVEIPVHQMDAVLNDFINPVEPHGPFSYIAKLCRSLLHAGYGGFQNIMLNGQYDNAQGCLYGGNKLEEEAQTVLDWADHYIQESPVTSIIDLHTGFFSTNAYTTIPVGGDRNAAGSLFAATHSNVAERSTSRPEFQGRMFVEGIAHRVDELGKKVGLSVIVEFTVSDAPEQNRWLTPFKFILWSNLTLKRTIEENWARIHGTQEQYAVVSKKYEEIFEMRNNEKWQKRVQEGAKDLFKKVFSYIPVKNPL